MSSVVSINKVDYVVLPLLEVRQKSNSFFVSKINADTLLKVYTVRPALYDVAKNTSIANSFGDDQDYYRHIADLTENPNDKGDFQRKFTPGRVKEIKTFLEEKEFAFFPNTIIANCELINDIEEFDINEDSSLAEFEQLQNVPNHLAFFYRDGEEPRLLIPVVENSILVIDGQHMDIPD